MITVRGSAPQAEPWHLDHRSWLLVLLSGQCLREEALDQGVDAELARMESDGLLTSACEGRQREFCLTDEGWAAAAEARGRVTEARRFLGTLEDRYAVLAGGNRT